METIKKKIMSDFDIVLRTLQKIAKNESQIRQDSLSMQSTQKRKQTGRFSTKIAWDNLNLVGKGWIRLQVVSAYK